MFYLSASEVITSKRSAGEILVFSRAYVKRLALGDKDIERPSPATETQASMEATKERAMTGIPPHASVFHWKNVCLDITVKKERRRILDRVDGWIKPGTLTALMVSRAQRHQLSTRRC